MSKCYSVVGSGASASATKTATGLTGGTTARPQVNELDLGINTTPADQTVQVGLSRDTTAGTSTAFTPNPLDPADPAAVTVAGVAHSVEPTYTASQDMLQILLNQRATYRWVAQDGREVVGPATASNGLGTRLITASAAMVLNATMIFRE